MDQGWKRKFLSQVSVPPKLEAKNHPSSNTWRAKDVSLENRNRCSVLSAKDRLAQRLRIIV